jgi:hypothetical protein
MKVRKIHYLGADRTAVNNFARRRIVRRLGSRSGKKLTINLRIVLGYTLTVGDATPTA